MTDFREKSVLSLYSQPFLYPIDGKLCPEGRGAHFIFSPQVGSSDNLAEGVSWLGGHVVLENWHQQGRPGYCLKEKTGCPPEHCGDCDFISHLSGHHNGPFFNYML